MTWILVALALGQSLETVKVESKAVERYVTLTAEILPFQTTAVVARVPGYIESVAVDRGSVVRRGQVIAQLSAPELKTQIAEAEAKVAAVRAQAGELRARLAAAESTASRLKAASQTAGAISANELVQADEAVAAAKSAIEAVAVSSKAAEAQVRAARDQEAYLTVSAPFDGLVTERMMHPGGLAGPDAGPIVRIDQIGRLRVVVAVPEANVSSVKNGQSVSFSVSGYPGESFKGTVSRVSRMMDPKTRTMPVELDVVNAGTKLTPGMYTEVKWPAKVGAAGMLVPATAVTANTERAFVIQVVRGAAKYVNVRKGAAQGDLVEISGPLQAGDVVIKRATDEIREGTRIIVK